MAQKEPTSGPEIQAFSTMLANPAAEQFAGVDEAALALFRRNYTELVAPRPWFATMLPQWGPVWLLILTSLAGVRWGVIFWAAALAWMFVVSYRRFTTHRERWTALMAQGRAAGIIA